MASDKQKRKLNRKPRKPGALHPDGDRRRKGLGQLARNAAADKKARREFYGVPLDEE